MYYFNRIKTYFGQQTNKQPEHKVQQPQKINPLPGQIMKSGSFELLVNDILEFPPSEDFVVLGEADLDFQDQINQYEPQEGVQNMYLKDFLLIGKPCEGRALTMEEWTEAIKTGDLSNYSKKDLYFSIFKGIDFKIRKDVWQVLANSGQMKKQAKYTYQQLTNYNKLPSGELTTIKKDVVRTNGVTKCLQELQHILVAYVNLSGNGYTQGLNLIAGILLRLLSIQNDQQFKQHQVIEEQFEERVFWVFVGVMEWKRWSQLFQKEMMGLKKMLQKLRTLMIQFTPKILTLIESLEWDLGIFAQYYVTICLYNCPIELSSIILDLFLLDGQSVIHSLLLRMLVINQQKILAFTDQSLLMKFLKTEMLHETFSKLQANRLKAKCLQDFEINFLKTCF